MDVYGSKDSSTSNKEGTRGGNANYVAPMDGTASICLVGYTPICTLIGKSMKLKTSSISRIFNSLDSVSETHKKSLSNSIDIETDFSCRVRDTRRSVEALTLEASTAHVCDSEQNYNISDLREEVKSTRQSIANLLPRKEELINTITGRYAEVQKERRHLSGNIWGAHINTFNSVLRVHIANEDDDLFVHFRLPVGANCQESAFVRLRVAHDKIIGVECIPVLENFADLVYQLNNGLPFGRFVCILRLAFSALLP